MAVSNRPGIWAWVRRRCVATAVIATMLSGVGYGLCGNEMPVGADGYYLPPDANSIPLTPYGDTVRRGLAIFTDTGHMAKDHVGNALACANCHLDAGRRANAAPMWAAYGAYPAYRARTGTVNTLEDRIAACFTYSMNAQDSTSGKAPKPGSDIYKDLITYIAWMANGVPAGEKPVGAGYPRIPRPPQSEEPLRGAQVYEHSCSMCHGALGQGAKDDTGRTIFPPLWGPASYNRGAGMARIDIAAAFIKANMPLGNGGSLTVQQAWDAAAFINSHERPGDPG